MQKTFHEIRIGQQFLLLRDGHKFIKLPRYRSADSDKEYNAINLDELVAEDAFVWFDRDEPVMVEELSYAQI